MTQNENNSNKYSLNKYSKNRRKSSSRNSFFNFYSQDLQGSSSKNNFIHRNNNKNSNDLIDNNSNQNNNKEENNINKTHKVSSIFSVQNIENDENNQEDEEDEFTIRQRITRFFDTNNRLYIAKITTSTAANLTFIFYVVCTYVNRYFYYLNYIDYGVCTLFILEHIINILLAHHFLVYITSLDSIIQFLVEIPPFFSPLCKNYYLDSFYRFINVTRIIRLIKGYMFVETLYGGEKNVKKQIFNIIIILLGVVFIFGGIIQMLDLGEVEKRLKVTNEVFNRHNLKLRRQFHHYFYFTIVSLTTVGYGEIIPYSVPGQLMITLLVVVILVVIPDQTSELINLSNAQTIYERKKYISSPDIPFVLLLGNIDLEILKSFCKEYFKSQSGNNIFRHLVLLINKFPDKNFEKFLNEDQNSKFIFYLQGDPMDENNLLRVDLLNAKSCIIFTDKNSIDPYSGDHQSLLLAIYVKKFFYHSTIEKYLSENKIQYSTYMQTSETQLRMINNIFRNNIFRICLQLNRQESCNYYYSTLQRSYRKNMIPDQLLVIESLKMNLLSKSCVTPGIIALISNLVIYSSQEITQIKNEAEWLREYLDGQKNEIFKFTIENELLFYTFQRLALEIFNKFNAILIAFEIKYKGGSIVKLHPQSSDTINEIIEKAIKKKFKKNNKNNFNENSINNNDPSDKNVFNNEDEISSFIIDEEEKQNNMYSGDENNETVLENLRNIRDKIKVSIYYIGADRDISDEIQKLDMPRCNLLCKTKTIEKKSTRNITTFLKTKSNFKKQKLKRLLTKSSIYFDDGNDSCTEVETNNEEEEQQAMRYLVDIGGVEGILDQDELNERYYTVDNTEKTYLYTNEIMRQGIKDRNDIRDHIIICGMHYEIIHFILPLRSRYIPEKLLKWIVILAPTLPQDIHDAISKFPKVIFIQGDPLHPENLYRANINKAAIAVILATKHTLNSNFKDSLDYNEILGKVKTNSHENNKDEKIDNEMMDAKTLFIYKSIKKINNSILIITELLKTGNIEFLLSSRNLKTLYKQNDLYNSLRNIKESGDLSQIVQSGNNNENEVLFYEHTPIYAAGEVYLPSLVDKITGEMFYNTYLLTIIDLLLIGEKPPVKKVDKRLEEMLDLKGACLFLIPCESRNESFMDMFKRLLTKNNMIAVALYRKNVIENFYYVYTNPKKTTLIRDTDLVFVLASTENIIDIYEKSLAGINNPIILNTKTNYEKNQSNNLNKIQQSVEQNERVNTKGDITKRTETFNVKESKKKVIELTDDKNQNEAIIRKGIRKLTEKLGINGTVGRRGSVAKSRIKSEDKNYKGKYVEIDSLQKRIDKAMGALKNVNDDCKGIQKDIDKYVKEEICNEFVVYLNKGNKK